MPETRRVRERDKEKEERGREREREREREEREKRDSVSAVMGITCLMKPGLHALPASQRCPGSPGKFE